MGVVPTGAASILRIFYALALKNAKFFFFVLIIEPLLLAV
jgi:hypothetical protein